MSLRVPGPSHTVYTVPHCSAFLARQVRSAAHAPPQAWLRARARASTAKWRQVLDPMNQRILQSACSDISRDQQPPPFSSMSSFSVLHVLGRWTEAGFAFSPRPEPFLVKREPTFVHGLQRDGLSRSGTNFHTRHHKGLAPCSTVRRRYSICSSSNLPDCRLPTNLAHLNAILSRMGIWPALTATQLGAITVSRTCSTSPTYPPLSA